MTDFNSAYRKLNDQKSEVSCHYLISREGKIYNLLCPKFKGWHAGISEWKNVKNLNDFSIGIELENKGHENGYNNFTNSQYQKLKKLIKFFKYNFFIKDIDIIFHSDIAPNRKKDPGEKFPWKYLSKRKIGYWHDLDQKKLKSLRNQKNLINMPNLSILLVHLKTLITFPMP